MLNCVYNQFEKSVCLFRFYEYADKRDAEPLHSILVSVGKIGVGRVLHLTEQRQDGSHPSDKVIYRPAADFHRHLLVPFV